MAPSPSRTFKSHLNAQRKVRFAEGGETSTRGACAPQRAGRAAQRTLKIQGDHLHRLLPRIAARVRVPELSTSLTVARLEQSHRGDGVPSSNLQTDRDKGKSPAPCRA